MTGEGTEFKIPKTVSWLLSFDLSEWKNSIMVKIFFVNDFDNYSHLRLPGQVVYNDLLTMPLQNFLL
tara:strand:+ start:9094 stop:9294 length:201 start_codon:yes stop_codon:yes gene_type:complete